MSVDKEILEALTSGIQSEIAAYVFYTEAAKKVSDDNSLSILNTLAAEEKQHFQILERQYDSLVRSEKWISAVDVLKSEGLPEIDAEMASGHKQLIESIGKLSSMRDILKMALVLEEEARDLFSGLAEKTKSEEAKKTFTHLAGFEEGHVRKIEEMIAALDN